MVGSLGFVGCRVIVYDLDKGHTIADTKIKNADKYNDIIVLVRSAFEAPLPDRVSVLIFAEQALFEYTGTVRKTGMSSGLAEIALYKGKSRDDRQAKRYEVNSIASVENLLIAKKRIPLRVPLRVLVVNMSTTGCLIRGESACLNIDSSFELSLAVEDTVTAIPAKVIRIVHLDAHSAEYGCEFQLDSK